MKTTRRSLFGLLAAFLAFPFAKKSKTKAQSLNEINQYLWDHHYDNIKAVILKQHSEYLEKGFLYGVDMREKHTPFGTLRYVNHPILGRKPK